MNFHTYHQAGKPWRTSEEMALTNLRKRGFLYREISKELGRTVPSVKDRAKRLERRPTVEAPVAEPKLARFIDIAALPDWYAIGWRVLSHDASSCLLEWPRSTEPRWPAGETRR